MTTTVFANSRGVAGKSLYPGRVQQMRGQMQSLHLQLASLPGGNPTRWHKLLDDYVLATAALYKALSE